MPRRATPLTAAKVRTAGPGRYGDGNGLYLLVRSKNAKSWLFRYTRDGKMREMGLGSAGEGNGDILLADARELAGALIKQVRNGMDPLAEREIRKAEIKAAEQEAQIRAKTFKEIANLHVAAHESSWRNEKHRQQWVNTLRDYAYPHFGDLPAIDVETSHVLAALEPIWRTKPETASRVRGRIESVLDYAKARGWRSGENPARWRGHLDALLPSRGKVKAVEHHPALPYAEIAAFMSALRKQSGHSAKGLEFTILTAARTGEVIGARWEEIDLDKKTWSVPAGRMKAGKEHRVPLSAPAIALLEEMKKVRSSEWVFPGGRQGKPLSNMAFLTLLRRMDRSDLTAHGFRSTFRDWAAERTAFPNEVVEMALAHTVSDKVEAAYRRGDLFEKRRQLAEAWARFCNRKIPAEEAAPRAKVVAIRG